MKKKHKNNKSQNDRYNIQTHGFTSLDLKSHKYKIKKAIPTEPLFVHLMVVCPLFNIYPAIHQKWAVGICTGFSLISIIIYWIMRITLRQSGLLRRLWEQQVLEVSRSRVSVGTIISIADHFHIILSFIGIFLFLVNCIYYFEPNKTWVQSLYMGLMAFNLKGFDDFQIPSVVESRTICAMLSLLNVLFVGFFAAAFLKPYVVVFGHK